MTNPTSNFGWQMPTSTDLVTDLPADFETFGQAVDTSLADLKGGTTGQVLSKASNTDMDFTWVAADDTNAIQNAIVDAKGDLIAASAADTPARLAVGNNGETLVADSSTATGLKWGRPTTLGCLLYKYTQSINTATATTLSFEEEIYDTSGFHNNSTNNSRITIPAGLGGNYLFNCQLAFATAGAGQRVGYLVKNNSGFEVLNVAPGNASFLSNTNFSFSLPLNAGDYVELQAYQDSGSSLQVLGGAVYYTFFQAVYLGA